jgi:hypothetical protein
MRDPVAEARLMFRYCAILCDGPHGEPALVLSALNTAARELGASPFIDQVWARGETCTLLARALRAVENSEAAFRTAHDVIHWLVVEAGGADRLARAIADRRRTVVAHYAVAALETYAGTLDGAGLPRLTVSRSRDFGFELIAPYAKVSRPVLYPRTAQLAAEWRTLIARSGIAADAPVELGLEHLVVAGLGLPAEPGCQHPAAEDNVYWLQGSGLTA